MRYVTKMPTLLWGAGVYGANESGRTSVFPVWGQRDEIVVGVLPLSDQFIHVISIELDELK
jgi:hypothetical protein